MGLLVVTGPPGAGKSAVARTLADRTDRSVLVAGDAFFGFLASARVDPWLPGSHDQNTERVATRPGHGFTDEPATRKMHAEFARAEVAERHVLREPPGTVAEAADAVATVLAQGRLAFGPL